MKYLFYIKILFSIILILFCGILLSCDIIDSLASINDSDGDGSGNDGDTDGDGSGNDGDTDGDGSGNDGDTDGDGSGNDGDSDGDGSGDDGDSDGDGSGDDGDSDGDGSDDYADTYIADLCLGIDIANETTITFEGKSYSIITDQTGLEAISNDLAAHYTICSDIILDTPFTKIGGEFTGTFVGNHNTISNLEIQSGSSNFAGLFSKIGEDGAVRNLKLALVDGDENDPSVLGATDRTGALTGENWGTIINVGVSGGYVKGSLNVGGLVGKNEGRIEASYTTGAVGGSLYVGGLVGWSAEGGTIRYSYATGNVEGNGNVGGLSGINYGTITASYATGNVDGNNSVGGLFGQSPSGTITASYFDATTTGQSDEAIQGVTAFYTHNADSKVYTLANGAGGLIDQDDFSAWDFTDIWAWQGNGQWPLLQFQQ